MPQVATIRPVTFDLPRIGSLLATAPVVGAGEVVRLTDRVSFRPEPGRWTGHFKGCDATVTVGTVDLALDVPVWTAHVGFTCEGFGVGDGEQLATRALAAGLSYELEHAWWEAGGGPGDPDAAYNLVAPITSPAATNAAMGLAMLEQAAGAEWPQVWIFASPSTVTMWAAAGLIDRDGLTLRTRIGSVVIAATGMEPAVGPPGGAAPPAGTVWAAATGPVSLMLGEPEVWSTFRRDANRTDWFAQREFAVLWPRHGFAVPIPIEEVL